MSKPPRRQVPAWLMAEGPFGIRWLDVGLVALSVGLSESQVVVGGGAGAAPLDATAYTFGALTPLPMLIRNRWPLRSLRGCFLGVMLFYSLHRRNISPAPALGFPVYDSALAGHLAWAIAVPSIVMAAGLISVGMTGHEGTFVLASNFLPSIILFVLAVMLGVVVRTRRALTEETALRLHLAEEERAASSARQLAEERLRIARELHDTVAHSMATITVQAGSALHLLQSHNDLASPLRAALTAIRTTSKAALTETRAVLGQLRDVSAAVPGLDHLPALRDAITAAGVPVTVTVSGPEVALTAEVDHIVYRIVQESLTNVLRHAGSGATACVALCYTAETLVVTVTNTGSVSSSGSSGGHGINGMRERAVSVGGTLTVGPVPGGFEVSARIPASAIQVA